jgi:hypothetical protein
LPHETADRADNSTRYIANFFFIDSILKAVYDSNPETGIPQPHYNLFSTIKAGPDIQPAKLATFFGLHTFSRVIYIILKLEWGF